MAFMPPILTGESFAEKDAFVGVWGTPVDANAGQVAVVVNGPTLTPMLIARRTRT